MKRYAASLVCFAVLLTLSACSAPAVLNGNLLEQEDLVVVHHNEANEYTLLVYRDPYGQTRHIIRRRGVFEQELIYLSTGDVRFRERGQMERSLNRVEATRVARKINTLIYNQPEGPERARRAMTSNT